MRQDLAKVICEDGRRGPGGYMGGTKGLARKRRYRVADDRDGEHGAWECLPRHESMTARLLGGGRWFSENLGALRGLISSSCGRNWDTLYGQLCRLVSPTGTNVERHVHQHLEDFLVMKTRLGEQGIECCSPRYGGVWMPLAARIRRASYYVHPVSRLIVRIERVASPPAAIQPPLILAGPDAHSRHVFMYGVWYRVGLEAARSTSVRHCERRHGRTLISVCQEVAPHDRFTVAIARSLPPHYLGFDLQLPPTVSEADLQRLRLHLFRADLIPVSKLGLNSRELRRLGLQNAAPQW